MKRLVLIINFCLSILSFAFGQKISFEENKSTVYESRTNSVLKEISIKLNGTIPKETLVFLEANVIGSADKNDFVIIRNLVKFDLGEKDLVKSFVVEIKGDTIEEKLETIGFTLVVADKTLIGENNLHLLSIVEAAKKVEQDNPNFKLLLGANFDLNDGIDPNNFYKELAVFSPEILSKNTHFKYVKKNNGEPILNNEGKKERERKKSEIVFGFYCGIYQSKSISSDSTEIRGLTTIRPYGSPTDTTVNAVKIVNNQKTKATFNNLGLYFAPTVRWNALSNEKLKSYLGFHMEYIRRRQEFKYDYEEVSSDSIILKKAPNEPVRFVNTNLRSERTIERYDSYFGISAPLSYIDKGYDLNVKPIVGLAIIANPNSTSAVFYSFQFNLTAINSGFNLGGEIRGFYGSKSAIATIHLSKVLSVKKIGDALVGSRFQ